MPVISMGLDPNRFNEEVRFRKVYLPVPFCTMLLNVSFRFPFEIIDHMVER